MSFYILYFKTGTFYIINTFRLNSRFPQSSFPSHHPSTEPSNSPNSITLSLLCSQRPLPGAMPSSKNHNCYKNNMKITSSTWSARKHCGQLLWPEKLKEIKNLHAKIRSIVSNIDEVEGNHVKTTGFKWHEKLVHTTPNLDQRSNKMYNNN